MGERLKMFKVDEKTAKIVQEMVKQKPLQRPGNFKSGKMHWPKDLLKKIGKAK